MTSLIGEYGETACDVYYEPIEEDVLLPVQLAQDKQPHWTRVLLTLLVEEAIADAIRPIPAKKGNYKNKAIRERDEALAWIRSNDRSYVYSTFLDTCEYLGLEPQAIRLAITKPGFKLATEWAFRPSSGDGGIKCGGEDLLEKIDAKESRRISIRRVLRGK